MGQIRITQPVIITPRLLPGVRVGDGFVSVQRHARRQPDGRFVFSYFVDFRGGEHSGDDLTSPRPDLQEALATTLTFLSAASENEELFPADVTEWASAHSDELSLLASELDEGDGLIEESYEANASQPVYVPPPVQRESAKQERALQDAEVEEHMINYLKAEGPRGTPLSMHRAELAAARARYKDAYRIAFGEEPSPDMVPNAQPVPNPGKRVVVYEETVTDESASEGDVESVEESEMREVDDVEEAARFVLDGGGGFEPSLRSYRSEPQQDMYTGAYVSYSFHLRGFTPAEQQEVYDRVTRRRRYGANAQPASGKQVVTFVVFRQRDGSEYRDYEEATDVESVDQAARLLGGLWDTVSTDLSTYYGHKSEPNPIDGETDQYVARLVGFTPEELQEVYRRARSGEALKPIPNSRGTYGANAQPVRDARGGSGGRGRLGTFEVHETVYQPNKVGWEAFNALSAYVFVGLNVGGKPKWDPIDVVRAVRTILRRTLGRPEDSSFIVQTGVYTHAKKEGKPATAPRDVVQERSVQVIVFDGDPPSEPKKFIEDMQTLGQALAERFGQEKVIVDVRRANVSIGTFGMEP